LATIGTGVTYLDIASRLGPDNKIAKIIEMQMQTNEILKDAVVVEGNLPTGHKTVIRTGLPSATWRLLNYGVQPSKSTTAQVTDTCGMLEAYAEVDKALADLNGNTAAFRLSEDRAFLEKMNQEMAAVLFYGNQATDQEKFTGFKARYGTVSSSTATSIGYNLVPAIAHGSVSGDDTTSIWFVTWGENTTHLITPKGLPSGFVHQDLGEQTLTDSATPAGRYQGYRTHYSWNLGLCVRDWRYNVRVGNIDISTLDAAPKTAIDLFGAMTDAYYKIPNINMGKTVIYCNAKVLCYLQKQAAEAGKYMLTWDKPVGGPVLNFMDLPIRRCDAILNTDGEIT